MNRLRSVWLGASVLVVMLAGGCTASVQSASGNVISPVEVHAPRYPDLAQLARMEGTVEVEVVVDATGRVTGAVLRKSINPLLDQATLTAAREWRFAGGPGTAVLTFEFDLRGSRDKPDLPLPTVFFPPSKIRVYGLYLNEPRSADPL